VTARFEEDGLSSQKKPGGSGSKRGDEAAVKSARPTQRAAKTTPRPGASATRPRIRASHSEVPDTEDADKRRGDKVPRDLEKRRSRARATVQALAGRKETTKKALPVAPRRDERRRSVPPAAPAASEKSQKLAIAIAAAGLDKKAVGVEVIDVSGRVDYADFLVIMTGTSDRHVHAIAMGIEEALKRQKISPLSVEGLSTASWVLMDFDDIVVHVFQEETRRVYDIEGLWVDAGRLRVAEERAPNKLA
jgi:ribosome-associated protein